MNHVKPRILFVCFGNTCRSVLAEYQARKRFGNIVEFSSAGINPCIQNDAENAIFTLSRLGIDASGHVPRSLHEIDVSEFDFVIAIDNYVAERIPRSALPPDKLIIWKTTDPYGGDLVEYQRCAAEVYQQLTCTLRRLGLV